MAGKRIEDSGAYKAYRGALNQRESAGVSPGMDRLDKNWQQPTPGTSEGLSPGMDASLKTAQRPGESAGVSPGMDRLDKNWQQPTPGTSEGLSPGMDASLKVPPGDYIVEDLGNKGSGPKYVYSVSNGKVSFKSPISGKTVTLSASESDPKRAKAYAAIMRQVSNKYGTSEA